MVAILLAVFVRHRSCAYGSRLAERGNVYLGHIFRYYMMGDHMVPMWGHRHCWFTSARLTTRLLHVFSTMILHRWSSLELNMLDVCLCNLLLLRLETTVWWWIYVIWIASWLKRWMLRRLFLKLFLRANYGWWWCWWCLLHAKLSKLTLIKPYRFCSHVC